MSRGAGAFRHCAENVRCELLYRHFAGFWRTGETKDEHGNGERTVLGKETDMFSDICV